MLLPVPTKILVSPGKGFNRLKGVNEKIIVLEASIGKFDAK